MNKPLVVVGSLNMDLVIRSPRHPRVGETILGGPFQTFPGGKGANQAVAIARLGAPVAMIGRVGQDDFGEALLRSAARDGVNISAITRDPEAATGVALITVDAAGQNTIVVAPGANARVSTADIAACEGLIASAAALVVQLECPIPAVLQAARIARRNGVPILLNPAPAQPLSDELLARVDVLIPNQTELFQLAPGQDSTQTAARVLRARGVKTVVVTLGEDGVYVLGSDLEEILPAHVVQVVDTVAAGDAFVGAFAVALAEGRTIVEAARWGNAAGALAVTRHGAQPSLPFLEEIQSFLEA